MVHRMPAQHYHTPPRQHIHGRGARDTLYQQGAAAYAPSQPLTQQYDGRYGVLTLAQPTIKAEYVTADEPLDATRSPNMNAAVTLKCETPGGDEMNGVSAAGVGGFHVMRDTSNLPMGAFHFGQHSQPHYVSVANGIDVHMDELCGASSTPPSTCSSSASVASSKDASMSTYAMSAGSYADLPTTSAASTAFVADRKRPYPCTLCPSKFGSKMELEEHQNSHTGLKPFQCDLKLLICKVCQSRFNRRSTLWNHKRIHSDAKPFVCTVCQMTFKWKNSLKCHKEMHYRKNETTSVHDNDILTYATAAKKQMKISNPSGGRVGALHFGGARKHQRSASMSLANAATIENQTPKKLSVPNTCNADLNSFEFQHGLGGALPTYDESFINGYQVLNPALLSVAAAAAVNYSDGGGVADHFAYGNGGPTVYGGLLHDSGKLFDMVPQPMTVIQGGTGGTFTAHFPPGTATTATALVHEGGYLNYG